MKALEVGKNYGACFGLDKGQELIFNGCNSWTGKENGVETITQDAPELTQSALEYINRATVTMGSPQGYR